MNSPNKSNVAIVDKREPIALEEAEIEHHQMTVTSLSEHPLLDAKIKKCIKINSKSQV